MLIDNKTKFISNHFESLCTLLGTKHQKTPSHHPKTDVETERCNETIIARQRPFGLKQQQHWVIHLQPWTYAYYKQDHLENNLPPFGSILSLQPPGSTTFQYPTPLVTDATETLFPHFLQAKLLHWLLTLQQDRDKQMEPVQRCSKSFHGRGILNALKNHEF